VDILEKHLDLTENFSEIRILKFNLFLGGNTGEASGSGWKISGRKSADSRIDQVAKFIRNVVGLSG
jgi:hypothetical protein